MKATKAEIDLSRTALSNEIGLLQTKVAKGSTLRAGERRFLLDIVNEADLSAAYREGYTAALDAIQAAACPVCRPLLYKLRQAAPE